jgi:unsaturated rhamnogalacturonyl hydrolase
MKNVVSLLFLALLSAFTLNGQNKQSSVNDVNTQLHLLPPEYQVPYGPVKEEEAVQVLNRIYNYLETASPARVIDLNTKSGIVNMKNLTSGSVFEPGGFRLISYEWGVAYGAMLLASEATGDSKFREYTNKRMNLIGDVTDYFRSVPEEVLKGNNPVRSVLEPRALDDAGSMCAAMIKSMEAGAKPELRPIIYNYISYISTGQFRLSDGTLARNRPLPNTLWLDDLYMSVPALAQMGRLENGEKYYDDAVKQVLQFSQRMFNKDKGLFMHGWVEGMEPHPEFYWGRCNGWAMLAITELLDVLPENYKGRQQIIDLLRSHIHAIAELQSGNGFWHQLLDRNDSYYETSATAIFTYCIADSINKGWIDARAFGPAAVLGWNAVQTKVNAKGEVEGTCVGTGMSFDPAFYYNRPVNVAAAHGYGPVIMAGAEIIKLMKNYQVVINDAAVMFYKPGEDWKKYK